MYFPMGKENVYIDRSKRRHNQKIIVNKYLKHFRPIDNIPVPGKENVKTLSHAENEKHNQLKKQSRFFCFI